MGGKTSIEWTKGNDGTAGSTWNPVRGCSRTSPGCGGANHQGGCYAEKIAARFSGPAQPFHGFAERTEHGGRWTGKVEVAWDAVDQPIRWRKPRRIFANSMSDLFHEGLGAGDIALIYGTAIAAHHLRKHTLQILTKRAERMRELLNSEEFWDIANAEAERLVLEHTDPLARRSDDARATCEDYGPDKPPPGIWLGVSIEDRSNGLRRAWHLAGTPAAVRFWSCEPLLEDLGDLTGMCLRDTATDGKRAVDLAIIGGESGPNSRPFDIAWARNIIRQCREAGVATFVKQLGAHPVHHPTDAHCYEPLKLRDRKGGKPEEWPEDLRVREFPT